MAGGNYTSKRHYTSKGKTMTTLPKDSSTNKAVKNVYNKKKEVPKTAVQTNKEAVLTLARQVKTLQQQRFGEIQSRIMYTSLYTQTNLPLLDQPVAFCLNNMYNAQPIFKGTITGTTPGNSTVGAFNKYTYEATLDDEYEWNARQNSDIVSPIKYKPIFTRLNITILFNNPSVMTPPPAFNCGKVRITILKLKSPLINSNKIDCSIPTRLGAYRRLAGLISDPERNSFNPRFHNVLYDKWVNLHSGGQPRNTKFLSIPWKYDEQVLAADFTDNPTGQLFYTNIPVKQQIWVLLSVDPDAALNVTTVNMSRKDSFRDHHGVAG